MNDMVDEDSKVHCSTYELINSAISTYKILYSPLLLQNLESLVTRSSTHFHGSFMLIYLLTDMRTYSVNGVTQTYVLTYVVHYHFSIFIRPQKAIAVL